ncbi:MAG: 50S ribosomal protein L29 [Candidatus Hydrogenedentota bacterium]
MLARELREFSNDELTEKLLDFKRELFNLRVQRVSGEIKNPRRIREVKRTIARILTIMNTRKKQEALKIQNAK